MVEGALVASTSIPLLSEEYERGALITYQDLEADDGVWLSISGASDVRVAVRSP